MNIAENTVAMLAAGWAENRSGTKAHSVMNWSPPESSTRKTRTLRPISTKVTTGVVRRCELSSPTGNMRESPLFGSPCGRDHNQAKGEVYPGDLPRKHALGGFSATLRNRMTHGAELRVAGALRSD